MSKKTIAFIGLNSFTTASSFREIVENFTGTCTVYAIRIRRPQGSHRLFNGVVQFTSEDCAQRFMSLRLMLVWKEVLYAEEDIIPQSPLLTLSNAKLYFGCQISKEKFSILWQNENVSVHVGMDRKWHFFLSHESKEYKLELQSESIRKMKLFLPPAGGTTRYLVVHFSFIPRISEIGNHSPINVNVHHDPRFNYYKYPLHEKSIRATDFTRSNCIGQSSALCLELPCDQDLQHFSGNFANFHRSKKSCSLEMGRPFSCNPDLVPIVAPPKGIDIPFKILFKVNSLVQHGYLLGSTLDEQFYRSIDPSQHNIDYIGHALESMYHLKNPCYEPAKWLNEMYKVYRDSKEPPQSPAIGLDEGLVYVHKVHVTPCKVYFSGPEVTVSNRILRHLHKDIDNFLRVSFSDEELDKVYATDLAPFGYEGKKSEIHFRILSVLKDGIAIGDKKFEFLAFTPSQLRESSLWMFAPTATYTASQLREWIGDFHQIRNVAKYAARLGQSFSSSTKTLSVERNEIEIIPDVKVEHDGIEYLFSDGIGKISHELAKKVAKKCGYSSTTSAFQIRYGGYKGVVAVDPTSPVKLSLRNSMHKFVSNNTELDVLACSRYQPYYLNRQLITLLSTLGVEDSVFEKKQKEAVNQLNTIITDSSKAMEVHDLMSSGEITNILKEMLNCGYKPNGEPFLSMMLQTFRASKLLELRQKTRILIPEGRVMIGCLDETGTLDYGQVFIQYSSDSRAGSFPRVVEGKVVVGKSPCLHPGDLRVLTSVNVPDLRHLVDCVVFPQKGNRPHPDECSGSDLDGDTYSVCWDRELIPPVQVAPLDYTPAKTIQLDHDVTIEEVHEYFTQYILNSNMGIISNAHTATADKEPEKALCDSCIQLAKLFSTSVDFAKTGIPAVIPRMLHVKQFPDFMEKSDKLLTFSASVPNRSSNNSGKTGYRPQGSNAITNHVNNN